MWYADDTLIRYSEGGDAFHFSFLVPDWSLSSREIIALPAVDHEYIGYDGWVQHCDRSHEINLVTRTIRSLSENPRPVHIAGISCAESSELIAEYYQEQGHHNLHTNQYSLPHDVLLTVNTTLRHILWCEKDKAFLSKKDASGSPYYALVPPLRTPSDLRALQQAARSGLITALSTPPHDEAYFSEVLRGQILTPFQLSQLVYYRWKQFGFRGNEQNFSLPFPDFSESELTPSQNL